MLAKKYHSKVVTVRNPINGIYTIEFESLNGRYKYNPGQFLHLAIDQDYDGTGQWPESRCFSMQSNPDEETLKITFCVKGKFTHILREKLKEGLEVWLKLPYGELFTQDHNKVNTIFIGGGTGVTPFLSLFNHSSFSQYINPKLYAGFSKKEMNIYEKELRKATDINPGFKNVLIYQDIDGIINIENIFNNNNKTSSYYISGPPLMIKTFKTFLLEKGLMLNQIKTDDWE